MPYSSRTQLHVPVLLSKVLQTGCLRKQTLIFSKLWRVASPGSRSHRAQSLVGFPSPLAGSHLLARSSCGLPSLCAHGPRARELFISLLMMTLTLSDQGPTLMISFNHKYFLTTKIVILGVRAPTQELRGLGEIINIQSITIPMEKFTILWNLGIYSVTQLCPILCNPMDCKTPGFPVHHHLPEFTQTHVHQVGDAIQPSHPLSALSPPAFNLSQYQGLFQ